MVSPQRREEASAVAATYHVAIALLGARTFAEVLALWEDVVPTEARVVATGARFTQEALQAMRVRRAQVELIAYAFMRLFRALLTGYTFQSWGMAELNAVPLSTLRRDFYDLIVQYAPEALRSGLIDLDPNDGIPAEEIENPDGSDYDPYDLEDWLDDLDIDVESLDIEDLLDQLEDDLDAEAQRVIAGLGPERLQELLDEMSQDDKTQTPRETEAEREDAHEKVGRRTASHADRITQNGARHAETVVGNADARAKGFIRVHYPRGDANPCGFCALLLTKGFVSRTLLYHSSKGAGGTADGDGNNPDEYHAGCHCRAEPVYNLSVLETDPRFAPNRTFADLYEQKIRGNYYGKDILKEWRSLIRKRADQASAS